MKKIDKSRKLSTQYFFWLEDKKGTQQKYNSSSNPFYLDVLMNLLACQDGLCAYTEKRLCEPKRYQETNWADGKFHGDPGKLSVQIDHFDPAIKNTDGWKWENLFAVFGPANNQKLDKAPNPILKPDLQAYDPYKLLRYDIKQHRFFPSDDLIFQANKYEEVQEMIDLLGINMEGIVDLRQKLISKALDAIDFGFDDQLDQFPTAFAMTKTQRNLP